MKFYIAAALTEKEKVQKIYQMIREKWHEISVDWIDEFVPRPFSENSSKAWDFAIRDIKGVQESDIFVIFTDTEARGLFIELWVALERNLQTWKPQIYIIWEYRENSIFYFHPNVHICEDMNEVLKNLG